MKGEHHIGVYCGMTPDFTPVLREVRRRWPDARTTAIVPPSFGDREALAGLVDHVMVTSRSAYSPLHPLASFRLARSLRGQRFDRYITLFKTLQQRGLAVASGAPVAENWFVDCRIRPMENAWTGLVRGTIRRELGGRLRHWGLFVYAVAVRVPRMR